MKRTLILCACLGAMLAAGFVAVAQDPTPASPSDRPVEQVATRYRTGPTAWDLTPEEIAMPLWFRNFENGILWDNYCAMKKPPKSPHRQWIIRLIFVYGQGIN